MKPVLNDVLQDLCTTPGPSGFERDIAQKAKAYLSPVSDSLTVDNVGNVIARIDGTDPALKPVMVYAHMDRVGMIVSFVTEDGFLRLQAIGGRGRIRCCPAAVCSCAPSPALGSTAWWAPSAII